MYNYSFQPNGCYFIFNVVTGRTALKNIQSLYAARTRTCELNRTAQ